MSKKENQHYVPQFYLREFSYERNQRQIGIFNIETGLFHGTAKLKFQASKKNYYGKDTEVEDHLAELEQMIAPEIKSMLDNEKVPARDTESHFRLLTFAVSSDLRTTVHENSTNTGTDKMFKAIYGKHPDFKSNLEDVTIQLSNSSVAGVAHMAKILPVAADLHYKLLINETNVPFITCDNPVIKYNIVLEEKKVHGGIVGLGNIGLLMFIPISPDHMLLFYDVDSYSIGVAGKDLFHIKQETVINDLNLLHFLNCEKMIFFNDQVDESYLKELLDMSKQFTRANQAIVTEHEIHDQFGKVTGSSILHSRTTECRTNLSIPFIKMTAKAKKYQATTMAHIRPGVKEALEISESRNYSPKHGHQRVQDQG